MTVDVTSNLKQSVIDDVLADILILNKGHDVDCKITLHKIAFISMLSIYPTNQIPGMYELLMNYKDGIEN